MQKPLSNIKVLDLTRVLAGPYCTMILADLGAEIIKLEPPLTGDDSRSYGPFINNSSLYYASINRGKKGISIDLKNPKGKELVKKLIKNVDIVVENFRPGTMEKLGLSYEVLSELNPRLIYASISGFGSGNTNSQKPAYDILVQALSGMMSITGWPNTPPTRVGMSTGDITAALFMSIAIPSALYSRSVTGKGQKLEVAMLDCMVAILENALIRYHTEGVSPTPIGNRHPTISPFQAFKAADKYFVVAVGNNSIWLKFCKALECNHLAKDPRFIDNQARTKNIQELQILLENIFSNKNASEGIDLLTQNEVPCGPINNIEDVLKNKELYERNMLVTMPVENAGSVTVAGNPIKIDQVYDEKSREHAPKIGEHNQEILTRELGLSSQQISDLLTEGVLFDALNPRQRDV